MRYKGEARFIHKYGSNVVSLLGIGASAELDLPEFVNFGTIRFGTKHEKVMCIKNKGLLTTEVTMEIIQNVKLFSFTYDGSVEFSDVLKTGASVDITVFCDCFSEQFTDAFIQIKWKRTPELPEEVRRIPIKVDIGIPKFKLNSSTLDFKTVYLGQDKTAILSVRNDGDMDCNWNCSFENGTLDVSPTFGLLEARQLCEIKVKFTPRIIEPFFSVLTFITDAGQFSVSCYAVIGVPRIKFLDSLSIDFGISEINKANRRLIRYKNTSKLTVEMAVFEESEPDGIFEIFLNPKKVGPTEEGIMTVKTVPRDYNIQYFSNFSIRSPDGERHNIQVMAVGGKAIVSLIPFNDNESTIPIEDIDTTAIVEQMTKELGKVLSFFVNINVFLETAYLTREDASSSDGPTFWSSEKEYIAALLDTNITACLKDLLTKVGEIPVEDLETINDHLRSIVALIQATSLDLTQRAHMGLDMLVVSKALQFVEKSCFYLMSRITGPADTNVKEFDLGIICLNSKASVVQLFDLPNEGNLAYEFKIVETSRTSTTPGEVFTLLTTSGRIEPGESCEISANVDPKLSGTFYQSFEIQSENGETMAFSIRVRVGAPQLRVSEESVDFGIIMKGNKGAKGFSIYNEGDYGATFMIIPPDLNRDSPFKLSELTGYVLPSEQKVITCTFYPVETSDFSEAHSIRSSILPTIPLELKGTGGEAKIRLFDPDRRPLDTINFVDCIIGETYTREIVVQNVGNVQARLTIDYTNKFFRLDAPFNSEGQIVLEKGMKKTILLEYQPQEREDIDDTIKFMAESFVLSELKIQGNSGSFEFDISQFETVNMRINAPYKKFINVRNTGDLTFKVSMALKLIEATDTELKVDVGTYQDSLRANELINIPLTVSAKRPGPSFTRFEFKVQMSSVVRTFSYETEFNIFDGQMQIDDRKSVSLGKILCGEVVRMQRRLFNYGDKPLKYRLSIKDNNPEPVKPVPTPVTPSPAPEKEKTEPKNKNRKTSLAVAEPAPAPVPVPVVPVIEAINPWEITGHTGTFFTAL